VRVSCSSSSFSMLDSAFSMASCTMLLMVIADPLSAS